MTDQELRHLVPVAKRLLKFTEGARDDFHEPDEQEITCRIVGTSLDNAMGDGIDAEAIAGGYQEIVACFERGFEMKERFNFATLIALARIGAKTLASTRLTY